MRLSAGEARSAGRSGGPPGAGRSGGPHAGRSGDLPGTGRTLDPWERYGWLMRGIWLVFLVYPLVSIVQADHAIPLKVLTTACLGAFAYLYVTLAERLDVEHEASSGRRASRVAIWSLVVLCGLAGLTSPVIGLDALGFLPFILSFAMFALPVSGAFAVAVAGVAASFIVPALFGELADWWSFALIVLAVCVATGIIRVISEQSTRFDKMSDQLAVVAERERVARDVHDVLGHSLTVVIVKAELAERLVELDPARTRAELAEIQALSRQALAEIRETVGGLRVARLDEELAAARTALAGAGIAADVPADPSAVDPRHRTVLAWVLREAVTNVVRHSDADTCRVELDSAMLRVADDGRGLEDRPEGNGLRGLRERVQAAGGTLSIATCPEGHGTELEVRL